MRWLYLSFLVSTLYSANVQAVLDDNSPASVKKPPRKIEAVVDPLENTWVLQAGPHNLTGFMQIAKGPGGLVATLNVYVHGENAKESCPVTRQGLRLNLLCEVVKSSLKNWSPENYLLQIGDGELNGKLVSGNGSFSVSFLRDDLAEAREKQKKEEEAREAARIEREKAVEREKLEAQQAAERANAQAQAALAKQAAKLEQERLEQEAASRLQQVEALKRERAVSGKRNAELGLEFLESNKLQPNVVALPSGLQYKVIRAGSGRIPKNDDSVICRYRGSLIDGKVFDATAEGSTATLKLSSLIAGFREALSLMQIGSKWQVFMPPELAYGSRGVGADIPPNAVLVFDIELVEIATR